MCILCSEYSVGDSKRQEMSQGYLSIIDTIIFFVSILNYILFFHSASAELGCIWLHVIWIT